MSARRHPLPGALALRFQASADHLEITACNDKPTSGAESNSPPLGTPDQ